MYLYEKEIHQVASWRKANAIHGWFVTNWGTEDDCTPISVPKRGLIDLRDTCAKVIEIGTKDAAEELLPPTPGFFFGSYEIDEWYWDSVKDTIEKLTNIIKENEEDATFEYQASW
jgi:hypothetical protein